MMHAANLDEFFDLTLSNEDIQLPKPHPEIYLEAAKRLDVQPDRCLVVEDNVNGIQSAKAAGMHVLEVADPDAVTYARIADALETVARGVLR
jgi:HAD superfamily hydrolase (TIGR01509 family)